MDQETPEIFVGIDVGGTRKGFHMVAVCADLRIVNVGHAQDAAVGVATLRAWQQTGKAPVIAIDSPCAWSADRGSRQAERDLKLGMKKIHCFCTPTRQRADEHLKQTKATGRNDFYGWVRNGMALFDALAEDWPLYRGVRKPRMAIETFPQAVSCYLQGAVVPRNRQNRLQLIKDLALGADQIGRDPDFIDAALCAIAARAFGADTDMGGHMTQQFGNPKEGFVVVPRSNWPA